MVANTKTDALPSAVANKKDQALKYLAITFFISGIWDTVAGILYFTQIGSGKAINNPPTDRFYAIFLASFFFCFAYLQFLSALNIKRYLFNVGCLIFGRLFYVIQLAYFINFVQGFPEKMAFTAFIDTSFIILYLAFLIKSKIQIKYIFFPYRKSI